MSSIDIFVCRRRDQALKQPTQHNRMGGLFSSEKKRPATPQGNPNKISEHDRAVLVRPSLSHELSLFAFRLALVFLQSCRSTCLFIYLFIVCLIIVFKKLKQQRDELQKYQKKVQHIDKEGPVVDSRAVESKSPACMLIISNDVF